MNSNPTPRRSLLPGRLTLSQSVTRTARSIAVSTVVIATTLLSAPEISCAPPSAQPVPDDFSIIVTGGSGNPAWPQSRLAIDRDGLGMFKQRSSIFIDAHTIDSLEFQVSPESRGRIWRSIERERFFHLHSSENTRVQDGGYVRVSVIARGDTQSVSARNARSRRLEAIVEAINREIPKRARIPLATD
jgi:hypothetical protein